jgi:predicted DNA-binding WGR domain protein
MRIYMQMPPGDARPPRFYHLLIQEDLLEGWSFVREWGCQGSPGKVKRSHFTELQEAISALEKERDNQLKRGYRVVYTEGQLYLSE